MRSVRVSFTVAVFIIIAAIGLLSARTAEAGAAPDNQGVPGQIMNLQNTVNNLQNSLRTIQDTLNSLTTLPTTLRSLGTVADGIRLDVSVISDGFTNACKPTDLVPLPIPGITGPRSFCRRDVSTNLHVEVYNQGGVDAVTSTTRVVFNNVSDVGNPTVADIPTGPVAGFGGSRDVASHIPDNCFDDNFVCKFKISVDFPPDPLKPTGAVFESNEINNTVDGECGGDIIF